jgi:hypothetical protein
VALHRRVPTSPYNGTVEYDDGEVITFGNRERPKVLLDSVTGELAVLFNGVRHSDARAGRRLLVYSRRPDPHIKDRTCLLGHKKAVTCGSMRLNGSISWTCPARAYRRSTAAPHSSTCSDSPCYVCLLARGSALSLITHGHRSIIHSRNAILGHCLSTTALCVTPDTDG